jgi:hypothetical protein
MDQNDTPDPATPAELLDGVLDLVAALASSAGATHVVAGVARLRDRLHGRTAPAPAAPAPPPVAEVLVGNSTPDGPWRDAHSGAGRVVR